MPVSGYEPWTYGIGSDCSTNWATITGLCLIVLTNYFKSGRKGQPKDTQPYDFSLKINSPAVILTDQNVLHQLFDLPVTHVIKIRVTLPPTLVWNKALWLVRNHHGIYNSQ